MGSLTGQWVCYRKDGSSITVDFSEKKGTFTGKLSYFSKIEAAPEIRTWTWADIKGKKDENSIEGIFDGIEIFNDRDVPYTREELKEIEDKFQVEFADKGIFSGIMISENTLQVKWTSIYNKIGGALEDSDEFKKANHLETMIVTEVMDWEQFKSFVSSAEDGFIYRGQSKQWRLRTSFHRTGHSNLQSYFNEKIPDVERNINIVSNHTYDVSNDKSLGALLNLAQHHGYPTPLLDWTQSPYVATFFAFKDANKDSDNENVVIFVFNEEKWSNILGRGVNIRSPKTYLHTLKLPAIGNNRVMPQQAITLYSNVDDIEFLITQIEAEVKERFLSAIAIPIKERSKVLRELSLMGITAASLFPGMDGVCRDLALKHFDS